jgi:hypothetical protein
MYFIPLAFAPRDWVVKIPPLPGGVVEDSDRPKKSGDLSCRGTYTECFGHKPIPERGGGPPGPLLGYSSPLQASRVHGESV